MKITFVFYQNLMNIENINKISTNVDVSDGHIYFRNHLHMEVKIVHFHNMSLNSILQKINSLDCLKTGKAKYTVDTIKAYDRYNVLHMAYIIY